MKKISLLLTLLLIATAYGQSTHTFSHKLVYSFVSEDSPSEDIFLVQQFVPEKFSETSKNSLLFLPSYKMDGAPGYVFLDGNKAIEIQNKDLNNNFGFSTGTNFYGTRANPIDTLYHKVELVNFNNETKTILGKTCTNYLVKNTKQGVESNDFLFCIDEKNEIDNTSFIFPKQEGKFVKGLILRIAPFEGPVTEGIDLIQMDKVNSTIQFDFQKEWTDYLAKKEKLEKELEELYGQDIDSAVYADDYAYAEDYAYVSEYANQPSICQYDGFFDLDFENDHALDLASNYLSSICSVSYYMKPGEEDKYKSYVLRDAKTATKNFRKEGLMSKKDANMFFEFIKKGFENLKAAEPIVYDYEIGVAEAAVDAAADAADFDYYYGYDDSYVVPYESVYGNMKPEDSNFAIDNLEADSKIWESMPTYCQKLDSILPDFSSAELKNHAKNYAGQICDMYLGEFLPSSVWYKGTLDAIRAEQKYFSTVRGTLNNNDTKLLDEFLNSLD